MTAAARRVSRADDTDTSAALFAAERKKGRRE